MRNKKFLGSSGRLYETVLRITRLRLGLFKKKKYENSTSHELRSKYYYFLVTSVTAAVVVRASYLYSYCRGDSCVRSPRSIFRFENRPPRSRDVTRSTPVGSRTRGVGYRRSRVRSTHHTYINHNIILCRRRSKSVRRRYQLITSLISRESKSINVRSKIKRIISSNRADPHPV